MTRRPIRFLPLDVVLRLHRLAIRDQGGDPAVRDLRLLESALAMPLQQFGGEYLHTDIPAMAAAYAYHICSNHPFVDGNKRTAFAAMIGFLRDNGWAFEATNEDAEATMFKLAVAGVSKERLAEWVRSVSREKPSLELRDLFRAMTPEALAELERAFHQSPESEFAATVEEAVEMIPLAANRFEATATARQAGEPIRDAAASAQGLLLVLIYRFAEDMGYEW